MRRGCSWTGVCPPRTAGVRRLRADVGLQRSEDQVPEQVSSSRHAEAARGRPRRRGPDAARAAGEILGAVRRMTSRVLWASVTAALVVLVLLPLGSLVVKSFQTETGPSLANYVAIGKQTSFRAATVNSLVFGIAASLIGLVL